MDLIEDANIIAIEPMHEKDALRLFQKKLKSSNDETSTVELAAALEYMPLAIVKAAAYVVQRRPRYSVRLFLEEFRNSDRREANPLSHRSGHLRRDPDANNSILTTWQISFDYIGENPPSAAHLLSLMSFRDRQGIPEILLHEIDHASGLGKKNQPDADYCLDAGGACNDTGIDVESISSYHTK